MKTFWKTHPALRIVLMIVLFVLSIALVVAGWKMTGQLAGLGHHACGRGTAAGGTGHLQRNLSGLRIREENYGR